MSGSRNDSLASMASCSSETSVKFYEEILKPSIENVRMSPTTLQELVDTAEKIINEEFAANPQSTYTYRRDSEEISVELDQVMIAMLTCVEECGGESGKRYVASAIVACSNEEDMVGALAALGTTWLTHLLFIFKTGGIHEKKTFSGDLKIRDGYTCVVTGFQDKSHPIPTPGVFRPRLIGAHILHRAVCEFDQDHNSESSALTAFDILVNFTRLSVRTLEELHDQIDHPSNGMLLQHDARDAFDRFDWCLKKTEVEHVYELKILEDQGLLRKPQDNLVAFVDRSDEIFQGSSTRKRGRSIDLPNPCYIAIHAAIAGVLHMSGAGKFFDELLVKYRDDIPLVRSWPELETLMGEQLLSQSVAQLLQSVKLH